MFCLDPKKKINNCSNKGKIPYLLANAVTSSIILHWVDNLNRAPLIHRKLNNQIDRTSRSTAGAAGTQRAKTASWRESTERVKCDWRTRERVNGLQEPAGVFSTPHWASTTSSLDLIHCLLSQMKRKTHSFLLVAN